MKPQYFTGSASNFYLGICAKRQQVFPNKNKFASELSLIIHVDITVLKEYICDATGADTAFQKY